MPDPLDSLRSRLADAMLPDRPRLRRRLRALELARAKNRDFDTLLAESRADLDRSIARRARRADLLPKPTFDLDLPILARRDEIAAAINDHQVVVICGETGSGKTTQLPKICLSLSRGVAGLIGHTQPRRIAARTVATRIAEELNTPLGQAVGYKVRFGDKTSPDTFVKIMTDGILLAETQGDRSLEQYDTLIIDEAHERSLNIDFLMGYLKQLLPRRPDLKVIITSATIDPERFAHHFALGPRKAPIIEVSGRTYPVEVRYRSPVGDEDRDDPHDRDMEQAIADAVDELAGEGQGDILVFLSGEREIRLTADALRKRPRQGGPVGVEVLPLYARLSAAEQMRVFQAHSTRRIVLATNVAETSLTVPGIRSVIDTGLARISRYSHRTKVQRLPIEPISQASAAQRAGRCGRLGPGICIRLYAEDDFKARPPFTEPEILRTNLASVILQMKALNLGNVEDFPFVEPPDSRMIRDGYETLHELNAIDLDGGLTDLGRRLARFPIDPRLARMILAADEEHCLHEVLVIAAALEIQDPRDRPHEKTAAADAAHLQWRHETSDFISILNLWKAFREKSHELGSSALRRWARDNYLSSLRLREWFDVHQQLIALVREMGLRENPRPADEAAVHRALLAGLLSNIGTRGETFDYSGGRASKFSIFPGSGLFKKPPRWVMAAEIVQTTKLYARTVGRIEPEWIEHLAQHLLKRSHSDEHWSKDFGRAEALERAGLFGVEIYNRRRVDLGPINPVLARELFIQHGLIEGETRGTAPFLAHNRAMIDRVKRLEAKIRKPDILAENARLFAFYDERIPREIASIAALERWLKEGGERGRALLMSRDDVMSRDAADITPDRFPDQVEVFGTRLGIDYRFEPGKDDDGVALTVPITHLPQLDDDRPDWLVPGMLPDKVHALFKCLPKQYRKEFDPTPQFARQVAEAMEFARAPLAESLSAAIKKLKNIAVPPAAWQLRGVPDQLRMQIVVTDERAKEIARSRDLADLRQRLGPRAKRAFESLARSPLDRDNVTSWDFPDLPEKVSLSTNVPGSAGPALSSLAPADPSPSSSRSHSSPSAAASSAAAAIARRGERTQPTAQAVGRAGNTSQPRRGDRIDVPDAPLPTARGGAPSHPDRRTAPSKPALEGYPAILDKGTSVSIRLVETPALAARETRAGLRRLFALQARDEVQYQMRIIEALPRMRLHYAGIGRPEELERDLALLIVEHSFLGGPLLGGPAVPAGSSSIRTKSAFDQRLTDGWRRIPEVARESAAIVAQILEQRHALDLRLSDPKLPDSWSAALADARAQLAGLMPPGFLLLIPWERLAHLPRYLAGIRVRLEKLPTRGPDRDLKSMHHLAPHIRRYMEHAESASDPIALDEYRWMLEEYRISLFAQELGTPMPISSKRLDEQWRKVVSTPLRGV